MLRSSHESPGHFAGGFTVLKNDLLRALVLLSVILGFARADAQAYLFSRADFSTDTGIGGVNVAVATGDFNGDGITDLAAEQGSSVAILLGKPDGTFGSPQGFPTAPFAIAIAVGDFNGDGKLDIVTTSQSGHNSIAVLLGNGDGTFAAFSTVALGSNPLAVVVGDFNGDGKQDLAISENSGNTVSILLANGRSEE